MNRLSLLLFTMLLSLPMLAQRQFVVVDVDTQLPIAGVNVSSSTHERITTDSLGHFLVPDSCQSLVFSHTSYEPRIVNADEVGDTIFLISKLLMTQEVYVFGKAKHREDLRELNKRLRMERQEAQLAAANPAAGFNILPLISKVFPNLFKSKKEKRRERLKKVLEEY